MIPLLVALGCTPSAPPVSTFQDAQVGDRLSYRFTRHREDFRDGWEELRLLEASVIVDLQVVAIEPERIWLAISASDSDGLPLEHPALSQTLLLPVVPAVAPARELGPVDGRVDAGTQTWRYASTRSDERPTGGWLVEQGFTQPIGPLYLSEGLVMMARTSDSKGRVRDEQRLELMEVTPGGGGAGSVPKGRVLLSPSAWYVEGRWTQDGLVASRSAFTVSGARLRKQTTTFRPADRGAQSTADCVQVDREVVCRDALPPAVSEQLLPELLMELAAMATESTAHSGIKAKQRTGFGPVEVTRSQEPVQAFLAGEAVSGTLQRAWAADPEALPGLPWLRAIQPLEETRSFPHPAETLDTRAALWSWSPPD
ncbi:MAG: DUF6068 family protein [Myxococcota bacterium]|nr:DUF6068 family protein [Myxococcota bacterium]